MKVLILITVVFSMVLASFAFDSTYALVSQGTSLPETNSKKICGDRLCSESEQQAREESFEKDLDLFDPTNPDTIPSDAQLLFVQVGKSGSFLKTGDGYLLTIFDVSIQTIYFSDRPYRITGHMTTLDFIDGLWNHPYVDFKGNPPNAELVIFDDDVAKEIVLELKNPKYVAEQRTLQYDVIVLQDYEEELNSGGAKLGESIPEKFGDSSLFIDSSFDLANLGSCNIRAYDSKLTDCDFRGVDFSCCSMMSRDMSGADLRKVDLRNVPLNSAKLRNADLRGADLSGNSFAKNLDLSGADLSGANLLGADLSFSKLCHADFTRADLSNADLSWTSKDNCTAPFVTFKNAELWNVNFRYADLSGVTLTGKDFSGSNFSCANLSGANLSNSDFIKADLSCANLSGADLSGADLTSANLSGADLSGADLRNADLSGADLRNADLRNADLSGADLYKVKLKGAILDGCKGCP